VGAQFIGLGLLGEYIGRIYHDVRGRPRFFVQEIRGANRRSTSLERPLTGDPAAFESNVVNMK
jgi:undecaprenyl-phosphate 4-deoxy-4-formamido-L-arabinose transferase